MYRKDPNERSCILITSKCDIRCPDCLFEHLLGKTDLSAKVIEKNVLPQIGKFHELSIAGGEPTIHPDFWRIMKAFLSANPAMIQIITNGKSFTGSRKKAEAFFSKLNALLGNKKTTLVLRMSVGDPYINRLRGGAEELKRRAKIFRDACASHGGNVRPLFVSLVMPGQTQEHVMKKYGLPAEKTIVTNWQTGAKEFGTVKKFVIAPDGQVYSREKDMVKGERPHGNVNSQPLNRIAKRMRL